MNQELLRAAKAATFADGLARWARLQPDAPALIYLDDGERERTRWTYAQLDREVRRVAAALRARAMSGRPVLLVFPPGLEFIAAFCGALAAGAVAVPVPFLAGRRGAARLAAIAADAQPAAILTTEAAADGMIAAAAAASLRGVPSIAIDRLADPARCEVADIDPSAPAFLQYTSGSTSEPKGIAITHAALLANLEMMRLAGRVDRDSVYVSWLPLFHDMGLVGIVLESLHAGAQAVLMSPLAFLQRPTRWLQAISAYRATISGAPAFAYELCCRRFRPDAQPALDLSSWNMAFCGAEPVRVDTLRRFADLFSSCGFRPSALYPTYGLAEATVFVSGGELGAGLRTLSATPSGVGAGEGPRSLVVSCGRGWHGQTIAIVDPEILQELAEGETGEIWVAGSNVAAGYWKNEEATRAAFGARLPARPDLLFLRTGDLGLMSGGELHVVGRIKDLLKVNGAVVHPQDIEAAVAGSHPSFATAGAAFGIDAPEGTQVVAVHEVALGAMDMADHSDAMAAAFSAVGRDTGVRLFDVVPVRPGAIPLTTSGKVRRNACSELYRRGELARLRLAGDHRWLGKHRP